MARPKKNKTDDVEITPEIVKYSDAKKDDKSAKIKEVLSRVKKIPTCKIEIIKECGGMKIGTRKSVHVTTADAMVKLGNAKKID